MNQSAPTFPQAGRRNLLAPVLIAFLVLGIVIALVLRFTPDKTAELTISHTAICPTHTVFKSDTLVVGSDRAEDNLYVVTTLRIDDRLHLPLFIKDFTGTLTLSDGTEITTSAIEKNDIPDLFTTFPQLKQYASDPLLRESLIEPDQSSQGMIILRFPVAQSDWDHRRSADLNVDFYHQGTQNVLISRKSEITKPTFTPPPSSKDE